MNPEKRIQLWSGPRNISTALMYSFAQRNDTAVVDEPLYAHYLLKSGAQHPGKEEVLASQDNDGLSVIRHMMGDGFSKPVVFFKQMTHHLAGLPLDFLESCENILLIRNPALVLLSYSKVIDELTVADIGIRQSWELFQWLHEQNHQGLVIDSDDVLKDPQKMLRKLCDRLGLDFQSSMLQWQAGARPEDGGWAKYWYANVHRSTGFAPFRERKETLPAPLQALYEEAKPYYDLLLQQALK